MLTVFLIWKLVWNSGDSSGRSMKPERVFSVLCDSAVPLAPPWPEGSPAFPLQNKSKSCLYYSEEVNVLALRVSPPTWRSVWVTVWVFDASSWVKRCPDAPEEDGVCVCGATEAAALPQCVCFLDSFYIWRIRDGEDFSPLFISCKLIAEY